MGDADLADVGSLEDVSSPDERDPSNFLHFTAQHRGPCFHTLYQMDSGEYVMYDARHYFGDLVYYRPLHRPRLHPFPEEPVRLPGVEEDDQLVAGPLSMTPSSAPSEAARLAQASNVIRTAVLRSVEHLRFRIQLPEPPHGPTVSPASLPSSISVPIVYSNGVEEKGEEI